LGDTENFKTTKQALMRKKAHESEHKEVEKKRKEKRDASI